MKKSSTPKYIPLISADLQALLDKSGDDEVINIGSYSMIMVTHAEYVSAYNILISFSDLTQQTVDFGPFLVGHPHPQYNKYKNPIHFRKFKIERGNIVWGKDWDLIFPVEQLHAGKID